MKPRDLLQYSGKGIAVASFVTSAGSSTVFGSCPHETFLKLAPISPATATSVREREESIPELRESKLSSEQIEVLESAIEAKPEHEYSECGDRSPAFTNLLKRLPGKGKPRGICGVQIKDL